MAARRKKQVSIIVPVYNESESVGELLAEIEKVVPARYQFEILFVDDGSTDQTVQTIRSLRGQKVRIRLIELSRNFGKEAAIVCGLDQVQAAAAIVMDGDLQHPPALLPAMMAAWEDGYEVVECVKEDRGRESHLFRFIVKSFYKILNLFSGVNLRGASDYKLLDSRAIAAIQTMPERNIFFRGMVHWIGFKVKTIPFSVPERRFGKTRWSLLQLAGLAITGVLSFTSYPLRLVTIGGFLFMLFGLVLGAQTIYNKYHLKNDVSGTATIVILILITGSLILLGLGIIGEYLARIYAEIKQRPRYVIKR
ncbi:MAG: glycosyltransferase family 2 protein [Spirochaetales bacterium]|nr:glycosyltransferase family 2 protein [Spirochaetales bacterium]